MPGRGTSALRHLLTLLSASTPPMPSGSTPICPGIAAWTRIAPPRHPDARSDAHGCADRACRPAPRGALARRSRPHRLLSDPRSIPFALAAVAVPRLLAGAPERLRRVGRSRQPAREPQLPGARLDADSLDVHQHPDGALHPGHVAHLRPRLHAVGDEPARLSPDQQPDPRRQHRAVLPGRAPAARQGDEPHRAGAPRWPAPWRRCSSPCTRSARSRWRGPPSGATSSPACSSCSPSSLYLAAADAEGAARRRLLGASVACYVLALLSKSIVMTLPLVLLLLDVYPLGRLPLRWGMWRERRRAGGA